MNRETRIRPAGACRDAILTAPADSMTPSEFVKLSRTVFAGPPPSAEYLAAERKIDEAFAANGNPLPGYEERLRARVEADLRFTIENGAS
jgi:hypothetical protein